MKKNKKKEVKEKHKDLKLSGYSLRDVSIRSKIASVLCGIFFVSAIGICAYLLSYINDKSAFDDKDGDKTYTVSRALAKGNKAGVITCLLVSLFFLDYLIVLRGPTNYLIFRRLMVFASVGLIISLLWLTVQKNKDLHYTLASFIFLFLLLFQINILYYFYLNNKEDKSLFRVLIFVGLAITTVLLIFACMSGNSISKDVFASFEILFGILFLGVVLLMGFYHN